MSPPAGGRGPWPRLLDEQATGSGDVAPRWAEHVQGVALSDDWWFITQADRLWRFPRHADLTDTDAVTESARSAGFPTTAGIDHLGDCDYRDGRLYVAMEGSNPGRIGVFDSNLEFLDSAPVDEQGSSCPWCAVDPITGRLCSSPFDTDHLVAYEVNADGNGIHLGTSQRIPLRDEHGVSVRLERVQGGAFSPSGCLYLTSDTSDGGIIGIDVESGRRMLHRRIQRQRGWPEYHIVEGIAYDARGGGSSLPGDTQVHVLVFTGAWEKPDYLWLRHYRERF